MTKEIKNTQTGQLPQVKGMEMNDRDRLNDMLATEKYLTDNLNIMQREASHRKLFDDLNLALNETHQVAREAFDMMFKKGWYKMQGADRNEVEKTQQQFANYHSSQLPFSNVH
jgi:spore coat protein CotF